MIIDFHSHIFPEKIVDKALSALSHCTGDLEPVIRATAASMLEYMDKSGVEKSVILNIATNERQQQAVNDFALSINSEKLISFGSVYPLAQSAQYELERIAALGLKGIKLHPDYQGFFVDDERALKIYEKAAKLGLITVFHAGMDTGLFEPVHCPPQRLKAALPAFGGGAVVAAHFGGYGQWYEVEEHLVGTNIYFDTSYAYGRMPKGQAERIIISHGAEKILFGSDMPWSGQIQELKFLRSLDIPEESKQSIECKNAERLLGL